MSEPSRTITVAAPPTPTAAGQSLQAPAGYEMLDEIGRGGMGVVYRARDTRLNREVAVKLLREDYPADSAACDRFILESQITGQLQHPGVPAVHELKVLPNGRPFLAMKLVKGQTLHEHLKARSDPSQERGRFIAIFEQICQAVGYAHAHRVIHRDLKPANVMVGAFGEVQVMDWGLAKVLAPDGAASPPECATALPETQTAIAAIDTSQQINSATRTGAVMGTPAYMPPEQAGGEIGKLDPRSDVFGLGAILCQVLTGSPPYQGKDVNDIRQQAARGELQDAFARLDGCGAEPELTALCKRCLSFQQEDRPADGGAVAAEIARIRQAAEERARKAALERAEALVREAEQRKRRRQFLAAAVLVVLVLAAGMVGTSMGYIRAERSAKDERLAKLDAQKNETLAHAREIDAKEAKRQAEDRAFDLRRQVYGSDLQLAYQAWMLGKVGRSVKILDDLRPRPGQPELRGFEWNCLANLCNLDQPTLAGPGGPIKAVAYLPAKKALVAANATGNVVQWDTAGWKARRLTLRGHSGTALRLAISPDGRLLAEGYADRYADPTIRIWDLTSGTLVGAWKHPYGIAGLAFSPDGRVLASGGNDYTLRLWDATNGKLRAGPWKHGAEVYAIAFSPDGSLVAGGGAGDNKVRIWETATGKLRKEFPTPRHSYCLAFTPDGKGLAAGSTGSTLLWDVAGRQAPLTMRLSAVVRTLAFSDNGKFLAMGTGGPVLEVQLWDVAARRLRAVLRGHTAPLSAAAFTGTDRLATASADGTVKLWEVGPKLRSIPQRVVGSPGPIRAVAFDRAGRTLAIAAGKKVQFWDVPGRHARGALEGFKSSVNSAAYSPDGKLLATGEGGWPAGVQADDPPAYPAEVKLWDTATAQLQRTLRGHTNGIFSVAFSPDSRTLASGSWDGTVRLWDVQTGTCRKTLPGHPCMVRSIAFSPDGMLLAAGCGDRWGNVESEVYLWNVHRAEVAARLIHPGPVHSVAFSPDGKSLAAATTGMVKLWNVDTRKERLSLEASVVNFINAVAFSPKGRTVAGVDPSGLIHLWYESTGQEIGPLYLGMAQLDTQFQPLTITTAAFSPDGHWLATGDQTGAVLLWDGTPPKAPPADGKITSRR